MLVCVFIIDTYETEMMSGVTRYTRFKRSLRRKPSNLINEHGETMLFEAVRKGDLVAVQNLMNSGCDVNHRNFNSQTVIHIAVTRRHVNILQYLIHTGGGHLDKCDAFGSTPLIATINGIVPWDTDTTGDIPEHILVEQKSTVLCLIHGNANLNIMDNSGKTALGTAIAFNGGYLGRYDLAKLLVQHGSEVNLKKVRGSTKPVLSPFFQACVPIYSMHSFHFSPNFLQLMLAAGVNLSNEIWLHEQATQLLYYMKPDLLQDLRTFSHNTRSLQDICRLTLRRHLLVGGNLWHKIDCLPTATKLKDFLKLKEHSIDDTYLVDNIQQE